MDLNEIKDTLITAISIFASFGGISIGTTIFNAISKAKLVKQLKNITAFNENKDFLSSVENLQNRIILTEEKVNSFLEKADLEQGIAVELHEVVSQHKANMEDIDKLKKSVEKINEYIKNH